jgi:type IV pilus assembly protein PilN
MIRINLHPVRQIKKVQAGKRQLLIFAVIVLGEVALMALLYTWRAGVIDEKRDTVNKTKARIAALKREVGDFDKLKAQRDRLIAQRNIINTLQKARTGPVWMMRELSNILTSGKGPDVDPEKYAEDINRNPNSAINNRWNPNRLWIESMIEQGGNLELFGRAKDYDDVAEFNKRIHHSKHFVDDKIIRNDQMLDPKMGLKLVKFQLQCRVAY